MEFGVPEADLIIDAMGTRTYESCVRAKQVFGIEKGIVVTQDYHLPRSLYLCESVGIDAIGVDAKRREYLGERFSWVREYLSRVKAWSDVNF
jgi:vancomycin permeability regulator SanA